MAVHAGWHLSRKIMGSTVQAQQVRTGQLTADQLQPLVAEIQRLLRDWGYDRVKVTFGHGCSLPVDQLWQPREINAIELQSFIEASIRNGVFRFGRCDLHIEDREETLEFRLCHESDIHFESTEQERVGQ